MQRAVPLKLLFSLYGRIGRAQFWLAFIALTAISTGALFFSVYVLERGSPDMKSIRSVGPALVATLYLFVGLLTYVVMALSVKRLHDRGLTGWWALVLLVPPFFSLLSQIVDDPWHMGLSAAGGMTSFVALIWLTVALGILEGQPGANKYGPDPREGQYDTDPI